MAGQSIPLISKREYNFDSGDATVVAVKAVPVTQYNQGALLVRVHSSSLSSTSSITVNAYTTAPSSEEPSTDFVAGTPVATATFDSGTAGNLHKGVLSDDFGGFLRITVSGDQATGNCNATISAELVVKD